MGRTELAGRIKPNSSMDIDPPASSWNNLYPSFLDSRRHRINFDDDTSGHVIGSPPPKGSTKNFWNDENSTFSNYSLGVPNQKLRIGDGENNNCEQTEAIDLAFGSTLISSIMATSNVCSDKDGGSTRVECESTSELSLRVQKMQLQQPQPMIICENVEDDKDGSSDIRFNDEDLLTLAVPPVDVSDEKKRPPMSGIVPH